MLIPSLWSGITSASSEDGARVGIGVGSGERYCMLASERTAVIPCHFRERLRGSGTSAQD